MALFAKLRAVFQTPSMDDGGEPAFIPQGDDSNGAGECSAEVSAVNLIASSLASVRWRVYRRGTNTPIDDHAITRLLAAPHPNYDRVQFFTLLVTRMLTEGDAVVYQRKRAAGQGNRTLVVSSLRFAEVQEVLAGGRIRVKGEANAFGETTNLTVPADRFLRFVYGRTDPLTGQLNANWNGALRRAVTVYTTATSALLNSMRFGMRAPGWIETELDWSKDTTRDFLKDFGEKFTGGINAGKTPILPRGLTFHGVQASPGDQFIISVIQHAIADVARFYNVPLGLIYTNAESSAQKQTAEYWNAFLRMAINPLARNIAATLTQRLLSDTVDAEVRADLAPLHAAALVDAASLVATLAGGGVMTLNELRQLAHQLNLPAFVDGDVIHESSKNINAPDETDGE